MSDLKAIPDDEKRYEPGFSADEIEELDRIHADGAAERLKMMQSSPVPEYAPMPPDNE